MEGPERPQGEDDDEDEGFTEDEEGGGGGGGGDDPLEDDHLDPEKPTGEVTLPDGYIYEAGTDISVTRTQAMHNGAPGYDIGSAATPTATMQVIYNITLNVTTRNSQGTYDWPRAGAYGLTMFYGVSGSGSGASVAVTVTWRSSYQGADRLPKACRPMVATQAATATATAHFEDGFCASSEDAPGAYASNILSYTYLGDITKRGVMRVFDPAIGRKRAMRWVRTYHRYRVSLLTNKLRQIMQQMLAANSPATGAVLSPATLADSSDGIDGPDVAAAIATVALRDLGLTAGMDTEITGPLVPRVAEGFPQGQALVHVSGGGDWNANGRGGHDCHGEIDGDFTVTIPPDSIDNLCNNTP